MRKNGWNDKESASFSALLADAMKRAERASRVERATRWGTRVLWGGGVLVGALAWRFEQDATTVGGNVAIILSAALCVGFLSALKTKSGTRERRASALLAARRLEKRFPTQAGVWVAAVDFSEEAANDPLGKTEATSAVLRVATVESARRGYAEIAASLDEPEFFAALTATSPERFRNKGKTRLFFALGVLVNVVLWGSAGSWEKKRDENPPNVCPSASENVGSALNIGKNEENKKNSEKKEETVKVEIEKKEALQETSLLVIWELLISELAQNAEIAETLETELERAAEEERGADEETATALLQLARELNANLTRPETGLIAQTRRLGAAIERERQKIEARWANIRRLNASTTSEENRGFKEIGEAGENSVGELPPSARRTTGREIAVFLTSALWTEWEAKSTAPGGVGDWTALELSRVLRSESAAERRNALKNAATIVGEWGTTLRREETAARILSESWRFDTLSQQRTTRLKRLEQENRALLARFAGRLNVDFSAFGENGEELEEAKRRFNALWQEAATAERECVELVERLRERLQSETAQGFVEFSRNADGVLKDAELWSVEADEAARRALDETASQNEERREKVAKDVENNRFGRAAERLESVAPLEEETTLVFNARSDSVSADIKGVGDCFGEATADALDDDLLKKRRFSAFAALLTLGVDERTTRKMAKQITEKEEVAFSTKASTNDGVRTKNAATQEKNDDEETSRKDGGNEAGALSPKDLSGEEKRATGEKTLENEASGEKSDDSLSVDWKNDKSATGEETTSETGAPSAIGSGGGTGEEKKEIAEEAEKQAFSVELPSEARRRFEGTNAPKILPEYEEKIRLYRRRIQEERR